jgi:hypothetical protein
MESLRLDVSAAVDDVFKDYSLRRTSRIQFHDLPAISNHCGVLMKTAVEILTGGVCLLLTVRFALAGRIGAATVAGQSNP